MTINKFQGKTQEEAIEKAKAEFGEDAVIMNVREIKPKGLFAVFKASVFEVTAAMKEQEGYIAPAKAPQSPQKLHESVNLAADEKIEIIPEKQEFSRLMPKRKPFYAGENKENQEKERAMMEEKRLQERLDHLSDRLDEQLATSQKESENEKGASSEELNFLRMLYNTLIQNEVDEKYVNQILDEVEKFIRPGNSVDTMLSNIYQKLILRFGQPKTIELTSDKPKVVFFIGPTGVGKTTTIAKIASKYKVEYDKQVGFVTADTYRIAATEQLQVYANILKAPMSIVFSETELNEILAKYEEYDLVFVDTAGFSHKNETQRQDMKRLLQGLDERYQKEVYLVLSATTKYKDLLDIVDIYHEISDYKLIFTKLDETTAYGNILNVKLYANADLSYVTNGQNVPDDIEVLNTQRIVKQLLGGNA